jgi:putative ABC transport system substrate-binding protein
VLATPLAAAAQQAAPVKIGWLTTGPHPYFEDFRSRLNLMSSALFASLRQRIVALAAQHRVPTVYEHRGFVDAGGLMSYGPNFREIFRKAATYVDRILKGTKPADLPIEQPTTFELVVNLKTANALGLTLPQSFLIRADDVIQ